jgi:hypothetical protein
MRKAMRHRLLTVVALASGMALTGCDGFDPMDKFQDLDIMSTSKPKLTGERKPVFPTGVPGVPQGVPPDLVKGYQPPAEPAPAPLAEAKPKPKPKKAVAPRRPPPQQAQEAPTRTAPVARTTTTTEPAQGGMQQMPGSQPAWPTQAAPAPAWPGPQR